MGVVTSKGKSGDVVHCSLHHWAKTLQALLMQHPSQWNKWNKWNKRHKRHSNLLDVPGGHRSLPQKPILEKCKNLYNQRILRL
jgi:hypothetical protein